MTRIAIVGGYGTFGRLAAERLARKSEITLILAGRSAERGRNAAQDLSRRSGCPVECAVLDAGRPSMEALTAAAPGILINASGPFQGLDYALPKACIAAGIHYIDLADARAYVTGISALDEDARRAGVLIVSGASSVPALSAAVLRHFAPEFADLHAMAHGISPGNAFDPGPATTASILAGIGQPLSVLIDGRHRRVYGWQGLHRHRFPEFGARWMGYCDVPDLDLFPQLCPSLRTLTFHAGVEVSAFHLSLWALSWLPRFGLVSSLGGLAPPLLALKRRLHALGSDRGGMFVHLEGLYQNARARRIAWHLTAGRGDGPYIPTVAATLVAHKIARGELPERGAMPCLGLFSLNEFMTEIGDLDIRQHISRS
jgi:saccharopine dehydrogenase-like NADP-dependent oxidoreductase